MKAETEDHDIVWGAGPIGEVVGLTAKQTYHLLEGGRLPAKKIGDRWVASRRRLLAVVTGEGGE